MELDALKNVLLSGERPENELSDLNLLSGELIIYPRSVHHSGESIYFIAKDKSEKNLFILFKKKALLNDFQNGKLVRENGDSILMKFPLSTHNRKCIQKIFDFTNPVTAGLQNSFGFGDRIGLANPGHLKALNGYKFFPVLAQQSIRELTRTNRTADEVMDAAVWSVFQEGFTSGFGADADHLKSTDDIDMMAAAGYKMFTFDPGEYVLNEADNLDESSLLKKLSEYPWVELNDSVDEAIKRYLSGKIEVDEFTIDVEKIDLLRAYSKYGRALAHVKKLFHHLKNNYSDYNFEVEISVDETDSVTSVFEHYFIASELKRLGVEFVSLAPRFPGAFEKGIDYKGDLSFFESEYRKHAALTVHFGTYKISLHSGSDKFTVYKIIAKINKGFIHIKTAGTSYLEALKVTAVREPDLFREILNFSRGLYESEKRTYHVSADLNRVKEAYEYNDEELLQLFYSDDARQVLHVTFGKVLTEKNSSGDYLFKEKIINCLKEHEDLHNEILIKHFNKHLEPFKEINS